MSDSRIHAAPSTIASGASFAGTCLTQTPIFKISSTSQLFPVPALENQGRVGAAEAERIRERVMNLRFPRVVRNVVEVARGVRIFVIDRRRQNLIAQGENPDARFESAC